MEKTTLHFSSNFILIFFTVLFLFLTGCGAGDSSSFSSTISNGISSYSCPSQSALDSCSSSRGNNCSQCTCTSGCLDPNAPKVKLKIISSTSSLSVGEALQLTLQLSNPANSTQTIGFTLNYPEGEATFNGMPFNSDKCESLLAKMGTSFNSKVQVAANTNTACETKITKKFIAAGNPVKIEVIDLTSNLELDGPLPTIVVSSP